ncbi:MAG TPA: Gfo/Idh/MocA family oxidoreductase [Armatimonadota bacterium]|nr:Gfo/Idh/MocA family oxidoreductase [Armatimonadota bacterium]HOM81748.1 Gfo/Idh/MocA family oxidoreductase [Armatimonadota bacterium]HPT97124.1 Gfo/Idh/MocA family oxidoreductase [Armatimonadota bacterium]
MSKPINVTIVGGGMITQDLLLPAVYQLQRMGVVDRIQVCALNSPPLRTLKEDQTLAQAFPGQEFIPYPSLSEPPDKVYPDLFRQVIAEMPPRQAVIVAVPDQFHYDTVMEALRNDQHVLCVKPLVLKYTQTVEIEKLAYEKGLFVGVEYHKRFDRRALIARRRYELGHFGEFILGEARLIEPYYYRHSNFQNWFTTDKTDPFVYIGCHYVDLVYFITGIKPVEVSVSGVKGKFPNGNEGFLWSSGRVRYENGAILTVTNGLGYPDDGAGSNEQGLVMYFEGNDRSGYLEHDDQFRGVIHSFLEGIGPGGSRYNYVNPDFFQYAAWEGAGYKPVGYGPDSVSATLNTIHNIESEVASMDPEASLQRRRAIIREVDEKGLIATPANSYINELVVEAARMSILRDGEPVRIVYEGQPHVEPRS